MVKECFADLKDIAVKTGYSISTVSRALKHKGELSRSTRERILNVAEQLGYHDNRLSNGMRTGKTGMIGVIIDPTTPFFNQIFVAMHDRLRSCDYLPVVSWAANDDQRVIHRMIEQRVEGIIIVPSNDAADNRYFTEVIARGLPLVSIDRKTPADIDFIGTDDYAGGWMTAEYLYGLGHRELGYYQGPPTASTAMLRRQGFESFCAQHADCRFHLLGLGGWQPDSDAQLEAALRARPQITAAGAFYDLYALQLLKIAAGIGRRIPEDLAVVGFGNVAFQWPNWSALTSFDQKTTEIAESAVSTLFRRIENPLAPSVELRIKPELIIRPSSQKA